MSSKQAIKTTSWGVIAACFGQVTYAGDNWAVIIASSCGYDNYRHQADAHHAYQILIEQGMDPEKIIFMACDDIAHAEENPFPGEIFNDPNGDNVYDADTLDYTGDQLNAEMYMAVMMGDLEAAEGGKVLQSTIEDNVFVFFVDHGAPGILAFPGPDDKHPFSFFYADQLMDTLEYMYTHRMYKELIFYVEACEAGSMFVDLPDDMNIYTMTASDEEVSSWAIYCDEEAIIEGKDVGTCLGDLFSINWMADTVGHRGKKRSLYDQYVHTQRETAENEDLDRKGSPVCVYGDMELQDRAMIEEFMYGPLPKVPGNNVGLTADEEDAEELKDKSTNQIWGYLMGPSEEADETHPHLIKHDKREEMVMEHEHEKVNSRDAKLHFLMGRYNSHQGGPESYDDLAHEIRHRMALDTAFFSLFPDIYEVDGTTVDPEKVALRIPKDFDCLRFLIETFENKCLPFSEYGLGHIKYLVEYCETSPTADIVTKAMDMQEQCKDLAF